MKKFEIKLLSDYKATSLDGLPLFYNYIYYNELMDDTDEVRCYKHSDQFKGFISYERPLSLLSTIVDYSNLNEKMHEK